jgi:hypothetical protein
VTLVYIIVYYFMVTEGRKSYLFFSSIKEGVGNYEDDITQAQLNPEKTTNSRQGPIGDTKSDVSVDEVSSVEAQSSLYPARHLVRQIVFAQEEKYG